MTDDNTTPDPPNYPPYASWGPEPEIHVHVTTEKADEARWDFAWLHLPANLWTAALGFWPGAIWARVLGDVHEQQSLAGAWFMGGAGVVVAVTRFVQRRTWSRRTAVWIAVIGVILALPAFTSVVNILTGGVR